MIGGAGKKIQTIVELAEELYERVNELRTRMESLTVTVEDTAERVEGLETTLAEQRAVLDAIAEEQGLDAAAIRTSVEVDGPEAEAEVDTEEKAADDTDAEAEVDTDG